MTRSAIVEIHQSEFSFSAGHFTIFSATEREDLHGHNYSVALSLETLLANDGLTFDYRVYKRKLSDICKLLDRRFLLPSQSRFLRLEETEDMWLAHFNNERIPFLKRDVVVLPLSNVTIEELSHWFLQHLLDNPTELAEHQIQSMTVKVFNGPGQAAHALWQFVVPV